MGGLLTFFAGPAKLKALLIGAMAMIAVCLALTAWALLERTWRLSCEVDRVTLQAQNAVLADAITRQNAGVDAVNAAGKAIVADIGKALEQLRAQGRKRDPELAEIAAILKRTTPAGADCQRAWDEIEKRRRAQP